jgi:hypothetical protein
VCTRSAKSVDNNELGNESEYDVESDSKQFIFVLDWELCHLLSFVIDFGTIFSQLYILHFL